MAAKKIVARDAKTANKATKGLVPSRRPPIPRFKEEPSPVPQEARDFIGQKATTRDEKTKERHETVKAWFLGEAMRQSANRAMMAKCEAYYDSEQWALDDAEEVERRGQNPVVHNEIKPTIDFLIGTERRTRVDYYVIANDEGEEADEDARVKTKLLKYLEDTNRATFERSYAFSSACKAGIGWLEVGRGDPQQSPIFIGAESWRNILWDSMCSRIDLTDARYLFRVKVVDFDIACALFPDKVEELKAVAQVGDKAQMFSDWLGQGDIISGLDTFATPQSALDYLTPSPIDSFNPRKRVLLLECWSREPCRGTGEGDNGLSLGDPIRMKMRVTIATEKDILLEGWSPYKHERFPFIPVWAYKNARTGLPYSPVRPLLGPQEALNHRMSRSLYEASANQMLVERGAIDNELMDINDLRDELNSPDGTLVFANGAISGGKVKLDDRAGKAQQQMMLAERDIQTIRATGNVNEENRGLRSTATSRVAMDAKAERGSVGQAELFDNHLLARQMEGEMVLSLAEQYIVEPMTIRVAGENGSAQRVRINEPTEGGYVNDITARKAHFVVGEQAWKQAYAESAFASLMEVLTQLAAAAPQVVVNLLDVVFDMHPNLPRKKAIIERIRMVNGQSDPDGKVTPEQQQKMAQQQAIAQMQMKAQIAQLQADVREAEAKGTKLEAEAIVARLTAMYESAQAATLAAQMPGITPIADQMLAAAGFKSANGDPNAVSPDQPIQTAASAAPPDMLPPPVQADGAAEGSQPAQAGPQGATPQGPPATPPQGLPPGG